ncbi:hypothetical protein [Gluconobacter oxydans]|uniref:Uncharacterized protein n=1 Tax=Gluconobacter oxydans DSM 3504 TaxID=1288313 RepID=A0A067Z6K5_GLUOY|nr:hypothetical protein [Gluconobacter oxydans]AHK72198.1 hypothetical protein GLS_c23270 [Gluconobacter oxydans DSM 3504]
MIISWSNIGKLSVSIFAVGASIATIFQGYSAVGAGKDAKKSADTAQTQAKATKDLAETLKESLTLTARAYEIIEFPHKEEILISDIGNIDLYYKNIGVTPARNIHFVGGHKIVSASEAVNISTSDLVALDGGKIRTSQITGAGSEKTYINFTPTKSDIRRLTEGDALIVFAQVDYDDVFNSHHKTQICTEYFFNVAGNGSTLKTLEKDCHNWSEST